MKNFSEEDIKYNKKLKKSVFEILLENSETFYIHCWNHPNLVIGSRGLTDLEKQEGMILVLGPYSYRNLNWDEDTISCEMNFAKWESVEIPYESIFRFFDKRGQILVQFLVLETEEKIKQKKITQEQENVIKIDFTKKNKENK
ncbi:MAG: hypothetical protein ACK4UJ_11980 [Leptonema sp. (in: bacteria)]